MSTAVTAFTAFSGRKRQERQEAAGVACKYRIEVSEVDAVLFKVGLPLPLVPVESQAKECSYTAYM